MNTLVVEAHDFTRVGILTRVCESATASFQHNNMVGCSKEFTG